MNNEFPKKNAQRCSPESFRGCSYHVLVTEMFCPESIRGSYKN